MPEGEPISHAEMIAAVKWFRDFAEACVAANGKAKRSEEKKLAGLNAVLAHLERTQPTDTQADLTERARAITKSELIDAVEYLNNHFGEGYWPPVHRLPELLAGFAERRLQSEREAALMDGGEWRTKLAEQIGKTQAAADEARRAAIEECAQVADTFTCGGCGMDGKAGAAMRSLASPPAPQETP